MRNELKRVASDIATNAIKMVPALVADEKLPNIETKNEALKAIVKVTTQDALPISKRIWAAVFAALTAVLAAPEVQGLLGELGPLAPLVTGVLAAVLPILSKIADARPVA